jgi:hypothetical protein
VALEIKEIEEHSWGKEKPVTWFPHGGPSVYGSPICHHLMPALQNWNLEPIICITKLFSLKSKDSPLKKSQVSFKKRVPSLEHFKLFRLLMFCTCLSYCST